MNLDNFLKESGIIDLSNQNIQKRSTELSKDCKSDIEVAKNCFLFVKDNINHSGDYKDNIQTFKEIKFQNMKYKK